MQARWWRAGGEGGLAEWRAAAGGGTSGTELGLAGRLVKESLGDSRAGASLVRWENLAVAALGGLD